MPVGSIKTFRLTSDGGFIAGGGYRPGNSTNVTGFGGTDFLLIKANSIGDVEWTMVYGTAADEVVQDIQATRDGGYVFCGDERIIKVDHNGNKQWEKTFGGNGFDFLSCVQQTQDGGYILGGTSDSLVSGNKTVGTFGGSDFWVIKLGSISIPR